MAFETARALHAKGANILFTTRDALSADPVLKDILEPRPGNGSLSVVLMDRDSLQSVKSAAQDILSKSEGKISMLMNNAGEFTRLLVS